MQPIIELKSKLEGIIKLEIIKEDGTLKEAEGLNIPFYNLITDAGLNYLADNPEIRNCAVFCGVGTSNTPPNVSDTALVSPIGVRSARTNTTRSVQSSTQPYYSQLVMEYVTDVGSVSGNLAEIGFFSTNPGGTMWSRALIKDSGGNPTTLTLLPTEQLKVTYTVRRYIPASQTGSFILNVNGVPSTISYTILPANIARTSGVWYQNLASYLTSTVFFHETSTLGNIDGHPSETPVIDTGGALENYVAGSFERIHTTTLSTDTANFVTGIGSYVFFSPSGYAEADSGYQCSFSPKIPKTSSQTLTLTTKISWGRTTQQ